MLCKRKALDGGLVTNNIVSIYIYMMYKASPYTCSHGTWVTLQGDIDGG